MNLSQHPRVEAARRMIREHCTAAETEVIVEAALRSPPRRDISPVDSVLGFAEVLAREPRLKGLLLERARMAPDDRERVDALCRWKASSLARFNVGFPASADEFWAALRELVASLWPGAHESRVNGALMAGVAEVGAGWDVFPVQIVSCMRESEAVDRMWKGG